MHLMRAGFSSIAFEEPNKAEANLGRLDQQLAPTLFAPLASLLSHSPDPDGALNMLERYVQGAPAEVLGDLARYPTALTYLVAIFGHSRFLGETFLAEPGLAVMFARDRNFTKLKSKEDLMQDFARFSTTNPDPWLSSQLARFKRRNYLRIVLKDVLGIATLGETTLELSELADVILRNTLAFCDRELQKRYGRPQFRDAQGRIARCGFSIVSLGKLGGNELNYSSDIDLLFLYSQDGETEGGSERDSVITNKEYAVRLAHGITRTITQATPQGEIFRVDLRLRPEGEQGDLAISINSALEYYEHRAREWELQMLIKARHSAGDSRLTREFQRAIAPYIYGVPTDFETVESVVWARERIGRKLREEHGDTVDVKLHRGGIRDIEFLTQCLQRLHGGHDPWVRSGGTLLALRKLNDKGWLSDSDYAALTSAYEFLRKVEHRIQLEMGQQKHRLPAEPEALARLAWRVGVEIGRGEQPERALVRKITQVSSRVDEIYQRVIHPGAPQPSGSTLALVPLDATASGHGLTSYASTVAYLEAHAPEVAGLLLEVALPERTRKNVTRFFSSLLDTSDRFRMARSELGRLRRALEVIGRSDYFGELLIHRPEDVIVLDAAPDIDPELATPWLWGHRTQTENCLQMEISLDAKTNAIPFPWAAQKGFDIREKTGLLRRAYQARVLELGASDLTGMNSIFASLRRWSALVARSVATALCVSQEAVEGKPAGGDHLAEIPFAVLGLGRLGLNEYDLASDADLVFVMASGAERDETALWTRITEKTIEMLSSYTRDGTLFSVDTRLRPRGHEGELVVTADALVDYFAESAQVWEALTYLKAFPVAGNLALGSQTILRLMTALFNRFPVLPDLEEELLQMRRRLEREVVVPRSNVKTAPGGYYDVDYAVSLLRLRNRVSLSAGANMAEQIAAVCSARLISETDGQALMEGVAFLRSVDHAIRVVTGRSAEGLPEHVGHAEAVETLARRWNLVNPGQTLARRLHEIQQQVRYVYRRVIGSE